MVCLRYECDLLGFEWALVRFPHLLHAFLVDSVSELVAVGHE
jgi:hypothetical protein